MITEIIPLGTGAALPSRRRHVSATALRREGSLLLFDCGEGTQHQLVRSGVKPSRLEVIFITHLHGDHFFGLPGLLSTMGLLRYTEPIVIVGPVGLRAFLDGVCTVSGLEWPFELRFVELDEHFEGGLVFDHQDYEVTASLLDHRIFTVGYRFQEKTRPGNLNVEKAQVLGITEHEQFRALKAGQRIELKDGRWIEPDEVVGPPKPGVSFAYCFDTRPCPGAVELAQDADLLYHDATFDHGLIDKAIKTGHATAIEAAQVAVEAGARNLLLGHFSARYRRVEPLVDEARTVFQNTDAAEELKRYVLHS